MNPFTKFLTSLFTASFKVNIYFGYLVMFSIIILCGTIDFSIIYYMTSFVWSSDIWWLNFIYFGMMGMNFLSVLSMYAKKEWRPLSKVTNFNYSIPALRVPFIGTILGYCILIFNLPQLIYFWIND